MKSINKKITEIKWFSFLIPSLAFYLIFFVLPAISSVFFAFTDWDGINYKFIGLANFVEMFHDESILTSFGNTIIYAISITFFQNFFGIVLAVFCMKKLRGLTFIRTVFFMPAIFSALLIGYTWGFILEPNIGALNTILSVLHLEFLQTSWLSDPFWARFMIIFVTVWQFMGYSMVIFVAGLKAIPNELYESANIDGAHGWKEFIYITFPLIAPSFTINIILSTIGTLKLFEQVYAMTGGGPGYMTESVAITINRLGFGGTGTRWGYGASMSVVMFLAIMFLTVFVVNKLRKREVDF
ncbi:MAG TPA: sugar ABC transporter permease [Ruminiclostridium sp.]